MQGDGAYVTLVQMQVHFENVGLVVQDRGEQRLIQRRQSLADDVDDWACTRQCAPMHADSSGHCTGPVAGAALSYSQWSLYILNRRASLRLCFLVFRSYSEQPESQTGKKAKKSMTRLWAC